MSNSSEESSIEASKLCVGDLVIVRHNPHDFRSQPVAGRVVAVCEGEGIGGITLFVVEYPTPASSKTQTLPFDAPCLERATESTLLRMATLAQERAAESVILAQRQIDTRLEATTTLSCRDMLSPLQD